MIEDEYTNRTDLSGHQKWAKRNPEKYKEISKARNKRRYALKTEEQKLEALRVERERWAKLSPEKRIERHLKSRYNLSYNEWIQMFEDQNYKCYTCDHPVKAEFGNDIDRGVVDHCHSTQNIRKILCHHCNRILGMAKENTNVLKRIGEYLNEFA